MSKQDNAIDFIQSSNKAREYENKKKNKAYKVTDWSITAIIKRPDGTWYDHTITDFPEHIGITVNEWLQDYKTIEEENNDKGN